jgi:hypothetical protein
MRTRILSVVLAVAVLSMGAVASPALAAKRKVPFGFLGAVMDPSVTLPISQTTLSDQMGIMARSGVESVRSNIYWSATEPSPNVFNWAESDKLVLSAAEHGLSLLPIVEYTPPWAAPGHPGDGDYLPSNPSVFGHFMTALVKRYGPHGDFWDFYPSLRKYAVKDWQIWNEPAGTYDWKSMPWPSTYTTLLKAGYKAVHAADHSAKVVSGAVVGLNGKNNTPWGEARSLYQAGAGKYFDILAVNAFTNESTASEAVQRSVLLVKKVRAVMRAHGQAHKPIWVTEVTWTAAQGKIPNKDDAGIETTPSGQAARLQAYYTYLSDHRSLGIQRAFWSTWATSYNINQLNGTIPTFAFSGLVQWSGGNSVFKPLALLKSYQSVARKLEGCAKTSNATACS